MSSASPQASRSTVVHVLNGFNYGGIENLCLQLLQHSPPQVKNVLISINPDYAAMRPQFENIQNLEILDIPYQKAHRVQFVLNLAKTFRAIAPSAVVIYPFGVHIFIALAARLAFVRRVAVHVGNPAPQAGILQRKWREIIFISHLLQTPLYSYSKFVHHSLQKLFFLPQHSAPLPPGCDVSNIAAQAQLSRQERGDQTKLVIGMVARLNKIKDQATLIQAFANLYSTFPDTELWLVGDGEEYNPLLTLAQQLKVSHAVKFLGHRSDVPQLLGKMDIYVFSTTIDEGFGIALAEAMAAGLPIIASDVPACREVLDHGSSGFLVPPKDIDAMVNILQRLIESKKQRDIWGSKAYTHANQFHNIKNCVEKWHQIMLVNLAL